MSLTRLSFLYPHLFKGAKAYECSLPRRPPRRGGKRTTKSTFSTSAQQREETYAQRYGTAAEPQPPPISASKDLEGTKTLATNIANEVKAPAPKQEERKPNSPPAKKTSDGHLNSKKNPETPSDSRLSSQDASSKGRTLGVYNSGFKEPIISSAARESLGKSLETVLHTEDPAAVKQEEQKSPHLHARPYVHHFDTYTLVQDLQKGGFTEDQSVTLMKAVRSLLAINLEVARQELVAKSDVENETYLFRAACSELRTEILNARKASTSKMATQRTHLQHEVDILSQKASQESLALKDDLRGMLNDRKMAVRMQHQARDSKIQELNYKITVALNSDSKSEVESLRWVLTRRAAMAIAGMAFLILSSLRYSSYKLHERELQQRRSPPLVPPSISTSSSSNPPPGSARNHTAPSRDMGTQTAGGGLDAVFASVEGGGGGVDGGGGGGGGYVSLG